MKFLKLSFIGLFFLVIACSDKSDEAQLPDFRSPDQNAELVGSSANQGKTFVPIAKIDPNTRKVILYMDKLITKFPDGGQISQFFIRKEGSKYGFTRVGTDAKGNHRAEAFQTVTENGKIGFSLPDNELVWFVTCEGGSCSLCMPKSNGSGCECPDFSAGDLVKFDVENGESDGGGSDTSPGFGDCTLGTVGAGMYYATQVIF